MSSAAPARSTRAATKLQTESTKRPRKVAFEDEGGIDDVEGLDAESEEEVLKVEGKKGKERKNPDKKRQKVQSGKIGLLDESEGVTRTDLTDPYGTFPSHYIDI